MLVVVIAVLFTAPWVAALVWVLVRGGYRALRDSETILPSNEAARRRLESAD
jgi:hypothetical protein